MAINSSVEKRRPFFFVYSLKKNILNITFISFTVLLVIFSNSCMAAAKNGLKLWANNVIPALFPFFIATELLSYTNLCNKLSKFFSKMMEPIFKVPGCGAYAFIIGMISGYPVGAKIVTDLRNSGSCSKSEGSRLLSFTNNSGPLFIIGTVGITLFRNTSIGILLLLTHILAAITVGFILRFFDKSNSNSISLSDDNDITKKTYKTQSNYSILNIGDIIKNSIVSAIKNILVIGGFIVLFAVIISILNTSHLIDAASLIFYPICKLMKFDIAYIKGILIGLIELTNGLSIVSSIPAKNITINIVICSFILGFGGISILFQVLSIISKSDLSIKPYIYGKLLQGIIAATYTYIFISNFSFLNFNLPIMM